MLKALLRNAFTLVGKIKKESLHDNTVMVLIENLYMEAKNRSQQKKKTFRAKLDLHYWSHINKNFKAHFTNSMAV